jgi:hypothetical protein
MTPSRVIRRRRTGLIAALAAVLFLLGHLGVEQRDHSWLLKLAGRPVDLRGAVSAAAQDLLRNCVAVQRLDAGAEEAALAVEALRQFSSPDSLSARVLRVDRLAAVHTAPAPRGIAVVKGEAQTQMQPMERTALQPIGWLVIQAEFDTLEPVVVVVRQVGPVAEVMPLGVWSSTTLPWNSAWRIRRFLAERVPHAPADLLACLDPLPVFAQPPRPTTPTRQEAPRHRP